MKVIILRQKIQKSFLDPTQLLSGECTIWKIPYIKGGSWWSHIWKIQYVLSFLFLKASLSSYVWFQRRNWGKQRLHTTYRVSKKLYSSLLNPLQAFLRQNCFTLKKAMQQLVSVLVFSFQLQSDSRVSVVRPSIHPFVGSSVHPSF